MKKRTEGEKPDDNDPADAAGTIKNNGTTKNQEEFIMTDNMKKYMEAVSANEEYTEKLNHAEN